ncbi:MAG TPA: FAD-binding oxidoreductase [Cytophagales bacterium]|nr:FAD-binding oxidoreductase [Cytophagales bacterium]
MAAGLWYPYKVQPIERALPWSEHTLAEFRKQAAAGVPGVRIQPMVEYFFFPKQDPDWAPMVEGFQWLPSEGLPEPFQAAAEFKVPVADTALYLPWLQESLEQQGVVVTVKKLASLAELTQQYSVVINCTGLGSRELLGDQELFPIQGQVRKMGPLPTSEDKVLLVDDAGTLIYIIPRQGDTVVGGTAVEGSWKCEIDVELADRMKQDAQVLYPSIEQLPTLANQAGLRPGRSSVRLERESIAEESVLIHNYGHGGAGITLCWGCAQEVVTMLQNLGI